jgi:hypothetical protein
MFRVPLLALLVACGKPECATLSPGPDADACYVEQAAELFRTDPQKAEREVDTRMVDPTLRDFVYLTATREVDPTSLRWCQKIQEPALQDRCRVLVSRPHLHRALTGGEGAAGGGPAPGEDRLPTPAQPHGAPPPP